MRTEQTRETAEDGTLLDLYCWTPETEPTRCMQIVHGMSEHAGRYARLARRLTDAGYVVFAHDQRGHGPNAETPGHFCDQAGWENLLSDTCRVHDHISERFPNTPRVLFGHSMGSFVVQGCLSRVGTELDAAVLCATDKPPALLRYFGLALSRIERRRKGMRATSELLQRFSFGAFNRAFDSADNPARTDFDWLSADTDEVDAYINDPHCGLACSTETWLQLLRGIGQVQAHAHRRKIPRRLPVLLIAGDKDPVARSGAGPHALARHYRQDGMRDVSVRLYADGRHELLNERMREAVITDLMNWLASRLQQ